MAAAGPATKGLYRFFVGNIPWTISGTELKHYFSQFGYVSGAKVIFNRDTGLSKFFGFVEVADKNTYNAIFSKRDHKLEGKVLTLREME